ncbi:YdiU family protein [Parvularcula sp. ZS-1/3]|uniref:Protein nucleotidyltransferase YdiU n=1 Tax=Parvularcula mediterranea TaxID=2732508 RepID=A0A7Y3RL70_9PROT|nr:YdiU family protein [Parvularcula mediterranea]NNU16126.1 YdiU family protein [Parvularcula mediterranea]
MADQPILSLGPDILRPVEPANFPKAILRYRSDRAAGEVGLAQLSNEDWARHFARFDPLPDSLTEPLALAYHGHQFRVYNPDIGDGRGFLFAQLRDGAGRLMDLGTKGSGRTPFSRDGDGRLTLKGAVREVLATEMLEALGVPTSRTLSVIETGEDLHRYDEPSPTRSAVMVRLSHSHIRFGTFQRLAALKDEEGMARLLAYVRDEFYPALAEGDAAGLLRAVSERMAVHAARLMAAGFTHGVLNTDNMNITGECFDYGPWKFTPTVDPGWTAASFDRTGLYAFGRQPEAIYWNLAALADALRPIGDPEELKDVLEVYPDAYAKAFPDAILRRLGVRPSDPQADQSFASDLFVFLNKTRLPLERAFFDLFAGSAGRGKRLRSPHSDTYAGEEIIRRLDAYEPLQPERAEHPIFRREPPTLLPDDVEALWDPITEADDWSAFEAKVAAIREYGEALAIADRFS